MTSISGDGELGAVDRILYFVGNRINNSFRGIARARRSGFRELRFDVGEKLPPGTPSPARALSEAFLDAYPWDRFAAICTQPSMHEIGCGSGRAADAFLRRLGMPMRYTGADIRPHRAWQEWALGRNDRHYFVFDGVDFTGTIPNGANLFHSASAAEHIEDDWQYFAAIAESFGRVPVALQIHLLPAPACLDLYGAHGYRQYPPDRLVDLARLMPSDAKWTAVALGGLRCTEIHRQWIADDRADMRSASPHEYRLALAEAISADSAEGDGEPIFWAFVFERGFEGICGA